MINGAAVYAGAQEDKAHFSNRQPVAKLGERLCVRVRSGLGHGSAALARALRVVPDRLNVDGKDCFNKLAYYTKHLRAATAQYCADSGSV